MRDKSSRSKKQKPSVPKSTSRFYQEAFRPEWPKRKFPTISERSRWFGERAGSLEGSASLKRLTAALEQANMIPGSSDDAADVSAAGVRMLYGYNDHRQRYSIDHGKDEAILTGAHYNKKKASITRLRKENPIAEKQKGIGIFGPLYHVDKFEGPWAILAASVDVDAVADLDLETAVLIRWKDDFKGTSLVEASKFSYQDGLLIGRITEPGIYQAVALPKHPWLLSTLELLDAYWPWLRIHPIMKKLGKNKGGNTKTGSDRNIPMLQKICELILCAPEVARFEDIKALNKELGRESVLNQLGIGIPPELPNRLGSGIGDVRNICDMCSEMVDLRHIDTRGDLGDLGGVIIKPPVLQLYCILKWLFCPRWTSIGPFPGAGFWGIGRITQMDIHSTNGNILIAGSAGGGVWRSDDAGQNWRPLMETEPTLTIGAVAFAPSDPSLIYAASGEDAGDYNPAWPGVGVYRSNDGGRTWALTSPVPSTRFSALIVHPTQPNTIYAAGNRGLHKSIDGGVTWITNTGLSSVFDWPITDVVVAHNDPDRLYIGVWNQGVYRSTTAGLASGASPAFVRLDGPDQLPSGIDAGWIKLTIGRNGTNGSNFLAAKMGNNGSRIFTTTDGGNIWTEQAVNVATVSFDEWASILAVDPQNENRLYAGAAGILKRSNDGGANWISINSGVHPDQQDLVFDPGDHDRVFLANDGGIYFSSNAGTNWLFASNGMHTTQLYDLDISQRSVNVVACGAQDNGIYYRNTSSSWLHLPFGWDGTQVAIDPTDPAIVYFCGQNGISNHNLSRSTDGGVTVTPLGTSGLSGGSPWVTIIKVDPTDPIADPQNNRIVIVCGFNWVFRSTNGGTTWHRVNDAAGNAFATVGTITSLEFAPSNPSILYLGTSTGALYKGINGGSSAADWTRIDTVGAQADALFPNTMVSQVSIDPNDPNHIWVTFAGNGVSYTSRPDMILNPLGISHVFKTNDGGTIWQDASGRFAPLNLPDVPTSAVAIDNVNASIAYVGTDVGIFRTSDGGITWTSFQEGLARSPVTELRLQYAARMLYVATMGRGVYRRRV